MRNRTNLQKAYRDIACNHASETCDWISFDDKELTVVVTSLPIYADVRLPVDVKRVVAILSR